MTHCKFTFLVSRTLLRSRIPRCISKQERCTLGTRHYPICHARLTSCFVSICHSRLHQSLTTVPIMAEYQLLPARQGRLRYRQADASKDPPHSPGLLTSIQPRYHRPSRIVVAQVNDPLATGNLKKKVWIYTKLAASRDNAFRFLRSVIATHSTQPKTEDPTARATKARRERAEGEREQGQDMPGVDFLRGGAAHRNSQSHVPSPLARPAPIAAQRQDSVASELNLTPTSAGSSTTFPQEKALVSGNGVSVGVNLAEPLLFLQGYDQNDSTTRNTAMLRGSLHLKVQKSAKIKAVTLKFRGSAITKWPEGKSDAPCQRGCTNAY